MNKRVAPIDWIRFIASLALCQLAGVVGSIFTAPAIPTWYQSLNKPSFTPPDWIFGPVWVTLYLLMGISLFLVWTKKDAVAGPKRSMVFFFVQLGMNAFWSIAFFGLRNPLFGLGIILLLWITIALTLQRFRRISAWAALLLLPYLVWVSFAVVLNVFLWVLNR